MGISNLGQVDEVAERGTVTSWAISGVTPGTGVCTLTNAASSLATGNQAVVYLVGGITDDINDVWTVTVLSPTSTQLNGCTATGTYTSGGRLSYSAEQFVDLDVNTVIDWTDRGPVDSLRVYAWEKGVLRFPPSNNVRQIRVRYYLSGNAPLTLTASTGIDDSLDFFSYRIAGKAGQSKGMKDMAQTWNNQAVGPTWESQQVAGGILQQLLLPGVRNLQRLPPSMRRSPSFGGNRGRHKWLAW